jgi:hypothetical protein
MSESAADQVLDEDEVDDLAADLLPLEDEHDVTAAIQTLAEHVDDLDADQQAARERRLGHAEDIRTLQERVDVLEEQNEQLLGELATLRQRTDLMNAIQSADRLKPDERAAVCVQTLYNEAWQSRHADTPEPASAAMDYNKAEGALGGSVSSRSLIYDAFDRAEEVADDQLGEDQEVVQYVKESRSADRNTRLVVDLREQDPFPLEVGGDEVRPPEEGSR